MLLAKFRVQPAEKRKFTVDYTNRLAAGELLTSVISVTIDPVSETTPLIISAAVETTQDKVTMYSSGGEDGTEYKVDKSQLSAAWLYILVLMLRLFQRTLNQSFFWLRISNGCFDK